jgi:hypothetical protein
MLGLMAAYFDDSHRDGLWSVAGYLFYPPQDRKLGKDWARLYPQGSHMADLVARQKQFQGWTDEQRDRQVQESAKLIVKRASVAVAVSCHEKECNEAIAMLGEDRARDLGLNYPFAICCYAALVAVKLWSERRGDNDRFAYVFEAGTAGSSSAARLFENSMRVDREFLRLDSYAFKTKEPSSPLGAADMLAWEWGLEQHRSNDPDRRPVRKSFLELINGVPERVYTHLVGDVLIRTLNEAKTAGML